MAAASTALTPSRREWLWRYPPLVILALVVFLAVYTLPSALNLPQANPGQVAEYAPVPGDSNTSPPGGNVAALGLGEGGVAGGGAPQPPLNQQPQLVPTSFNCVGSPPRQTEDPLSPPCVPFYHGDNGGATWVGVSGKQINVVFRFAVLQGGTCSSGDSQSNVCGAPSGYYDMENPNDVNQYFLFRYLHDWDVYFNHRFQTYGRHVHFWVWNYGDTNDYLQNGYGPNNASAEGADNYKHVYSGLAHPFAALDEAGLYSESYTTQLSVHGVLDFGGNGFSQKLANEYPGLYWSYPATQDRIAQLFASFACNRVVIPGKVTFSGNGDLGANRKIAVLLTDDHQYPELQAQQKAVLQYMQHDCNFVPDDTEYFHYASGQQSSGPESGWGTTNVARMISKGITTILWPGGAEGEDQAAANTQKWFPEWVLMGDTVLDGSSFGSNAPPQEMQHTWVESTEPLINADGYPVEPACYQAITAVDPSIPRSGFSDIVYACIFYDDVRQLFTGIQLAGPHLTPKNMDEGFHAIPARPSTTNTQVSCYYLPGDYTCVKDAEAMWWDPNAQPSGSSSPGYYRMWRNGQRFLPGQWPSGDITEGKQPNDVINLYGGGFFISIRPD